MFGQSYLHSSLSDFDQPYGYRPSTAYVGVPAWVNESPRHLERSQMSHTIPPHHWGVSSLMGNYGSPYAYGSPYGYQSAYQSSPYLYQSVYPQSSPYGYGYNNYGYQSG